MDFDKGKAQHRRDKLRPVPDEARIPQSHLYSALETLLHPRRRRGVFDLMDSDPDRSNEHIVGTEAETSSREKQILETIASRKRKSKIGDGGVMEVSESEILTVKKAKRSNDQRVEKLPNPKDASMGNAKMNETNNVILGEETIQATNDEEGKERDSLVSSNFIRMNHYILMWCRFVPIAKTKARNVFGLLRRGPAGDRMTSGHAKLVLTVKPSVK
jgi:hypothetical protein